MIMSIYACESMCIADGCVSSGWWCGGGDEDDDDDDDDDGVDDDDDDVCVRARVCGYTEAVPVNRL